MQLVSFEETLTLERAKARQRNRELTQHSQKIALAILEQMDMLCWNHQDLANASGLTLQQVQTLLRGNTTFSADTLAYLESILKTSLAPV